MHETHQQQNHIFYEICKARKIKILMTTNSRSIIKKKRKSSKLNKLSTVEALAGAVYILGEPDLTHKLLQKFKWGNTFFELNKNLLQDYSKAQSESEILEICHEYRLANA